MASATRLCLFLYWMKGTSRSALFDRIRVADEAGVHSIWVSEGPGRDVFTTMAQIVECTSNVEVGSSIVNVFSRSPAALAQHFATLDEISGGRMLIGLGAGRPAVMENFHGIPFRRPLRRIRESVEIINMLLSGKRLKYEGRIFQLDHEGLDFEPVRKHIPIFIGALSPSSIRQTAEIADGWLPAWTPLEDLPGLIGDFRNLAARAGRAPGDLTVRSPGTTILTKGEEAARSMVARTFATYVAGKGDIYFRHLSRLGHGEVCERIRDAWRSAGAEAAARVIPPALQQSVGLVTDSIEEARERIAREAAAGVDLHVVDLRVDSARELEETLDALRA